MRKLLFTALCSVALCTVALYPTFSVLAAKPKAKSSKEKPNGNCKKVNRFRWYEEVRVTGKNLPPLTNVDVYVIPNKTWQMGDRFGPNNPSDPQDVTSDGAETIATDSDGKLLCTRIYPQPLTEGKYDIVIDANQDGTYNDSDAIDGGTRRGRDRKGFKVIDSMMDP